MLKKIWYLKFFSILFVLQSCTEAKAQWNPVNSGTSYEINDIQFLDPNVGFYCGLEGIHKSINGGISWYTIPFSGVYQLLLEQSIYFDIHFFNSSTGVCVGSSATSLNEIIIRTTNGGTTWSIVHSGGPFISGLNGLYFINSLEGIAAGDKGRILRTNDGGLTWQSVNSGTTENLLSVFFRNSSDGYAVGEEILLTTATGGSSWSATSYPNDELYSVHFPDNNTGYVVGDKVLKRTGASWQVLLTPFTSRVSDTWFLTSDVGFLVTWNSDEVLRTNDGGLVWEVQDLPGHFNCIYFYNDSLGFIGGEDGVMYHTTNEGGIYKPIASFTTSSTSYCADSVIELTNQGPASYSYTWSLDGQIYSHAKDTILSLLGAGSMNLQVSLIADNGSALDTFTQSIFIQQSLVISPFNLTATTDSLCPNTSTNIIISNSQTGTRYQLKKGTTNIGSDKFGNGGSLSFPTGNVNSTTTFTIVATRHNACGSNSDTSHITIYTALPDPNLSVVADTLICKGGSTNVLVFNSQIGVKYQLKSGNTDVSIQVIGNGATISLPSIPFNYDVTLSIYATGLLGCGITLSSTQRIKIRQLTVDFTPDMSSQFIDEAATFTNNSNADSYLWLFDSSASIQQWSGQTPPALSFNSLGPKEITLIGNTVIGCTDTVTQAINVYQHVNGGNGTTCLFDSIENMSGVLGTTTSSSAILDYHVDIYGNSYVAGYNFDYYSCGGYSGCYSFYIKKYDYLGNLIWNKYQDPNAYISRNNYYATYINGIATDSAENVYITGSYGSLVFQMDTIYVQHSNFTKEFFIIKLDSSGVAQWIIHSNANTGPYCTDCTIAGTDIKFANSNQIFVSIYKVYGSIGPITFSDGNNINIPHSYYDLIILEINSDGLFKKSYGAVAQPSSFHYAFFGRYHPSSSGIYSGKYTAISPKIRLLPNGKIFVIGGYAGRYVDFDSIRIEPINQNHKYYNGFVSILDTLNGWEKAYTIFDMDGGEYFLDQFAIDDAGNYYIAMAFTSYPNLQFKNLIVNNIPSGTFIAKFSPDGDVLWYNIGPVFKPKSLRLSEDQKELIIYGDYDEFLGLDAQNADHLGARSNGETDAFLASLDTSGNLNWVENIGGPSDNDNAFFMEWNPCVNSFYCLGKGGDGIKIDNISIIYADNHNFLLKYSPSGICHGFACRFLAAQPENKTTCFGQSTSFSILLAGFDSLSYQWQADTGAGFTNLVNGGFYSNTQAPTLHVTGISTSMDGSRYRCIVSGDTNLVSSAALLHIDRLPQVTLLCNPVEVCEGNSSTFYAHGADSYQFFVGSTGQGAESIDSVIQLSNLPANQIISVKGRNHCGLSTAVSDIIIKPLPDITQQPLNQNIYEDSVATFSVVATSNIARYEWQGHLNGDPLQYITEDSINYFGTKTTNLVIKGVKLAMDGDRFRCRIDGSNGCVALSTFATLNVTEQPYPAGINYTNLELFEVFPNPFTSAFEIIIQLHKPSQISLQLFDILGKVRENIDSGNAETSYRFMIESEQLHLTSGPYLLKCSVNGMTFFKKVLLLR